MISCAKCGVQNRSEAKFCSQCGTRIQQPRTDVLVIFANPTGTPALRLGAEDREIRSSLSRHISDQRDAVVHIDTSHATTIHDLRIALLEKNYRIIQFSGHSSGTGLLFEDSNGDIQEISFEILASFLAANSPPLECVVLNACSSLDQGKLLAFDVPFVIAMKAPIGDKLAIEFSRGFYDSVAAGKTIEFAYEEGRRCMQIVAGSQADLPVLVKHNVLDGRRHPQLGIHSVAYDRWYAELSAGKAEIRLHPSTAHDVNVLLSILGQVLRSKGFDKQVIDRVSVIVWELLSNVARHVSNSPATIELKIDSAYLRAIQVSIADRGDGFPLRSTLENQWLQMKSGEREHGVGRVYRLADSVTQHLPSQFDPFHTIECSLYSIVRSSFAFDQFPWCAKITLAYEGSRSAWLGSEHYPLYSTADALHFALEHDIHELLDVYLNTLLVSAPEYLCIAVLGQPPTEKMPSPIDVVPAALKAYMGQFFERGRVIVFSDTGLYALWRLSEQYGMPYFTSEDTCFQRLAEIDAKLRRAQQPPFQPSN